MGDRIERAASLTAAWACIVCIWLWALIVSGRDAELDWGIWIWLVAISRFAICAMATVSIYRDRIRLPLASPTLTEGHGR